MIDQLLSMEHSDGFVALSFTGSVLSLERNISDFMGSLSKNIHCNLLFLSSLLILQPSLL